MANEFIKRDGQIIVNVDHAEAYIPADLFVDEENSTAIAVTYGEAFKVMGIFNLRLSNSNDEDDIESQPLRTFNYPNMITTYPSSSYTKEMSLDGKSDPIKYVVLKYTRGDIMMSATMPKNGDNAVKFLTVLTQGKLPNTLKYNDIITLWHKNLDSNSTNPGVPSLYMQCVISELYRDAKNPSLQFRKTYGKNPNNNDYIVFNMRAAAAYSSVFSAQVFEDMGRMLTTSVNMCRRDLPQSISPIEKVLYM